MSFNNDSVGQQVQELYDAMRSLHAQCETGDMTWNQITDELLIHIDTLNDIKRRLA